CVLSAPSLDLNHAFPADLFRHHARSPKGQFEAGRTRRPADRSAGLLKGNLYPVLVAASITIAVVIGESAIRSGIPATEPLAVVAAAKAEARIAERIEPAMLKSVFPAPHQPVAETAAFLKSHFTVVLPIIPAVVFAVIAISAIVLPAAA